MTRRRWIADELHHNRAALVGDHADHLIRVLRAQVGQVFDIAAAGRVRRGRVASVSPAESRVEFELGEDLPALPQVRITLLLAIYKFDRMEWAIEKCTELGVSSIFPMVARRTEAHLAVAAGKRVERWRRLALQAAEQSRRPQPPEIALPARLTRKALEVEADARIVLAETEACRTLSGVLQGGPWESVALAVGPEGGWSEDELKLFAESAWTAATLGPAILRAETAAIAASAVVQSLAQGRTSAPQTSA